MVSEYLVVGGKYHGDVYTTLDNVISLLPNAGLPFPIVLELNASSKDRFEDFKPVFKILHALEKEQGVLGHERMVRAAAQSLAPYVDTLWPHRDKIYGLLDSKGGCHHTVTPNYSSVKPYVSGSPKPYFIMWTFPTVTHAIVWTLAGGNKNLESWRGLDGWIAQAQAPFEPRRALRVPVRPVVTPLRHYEIPDSEEEGDEKKELKSTPGSPINSLASFPSLSSPPSRSSPFPGGKSLPDLLATLSTSPSPKSRARSQSPSKISKTKTKTSVPAPAPPPESSKHAKDGPNGLSRALAAVFGNQPLVSPAALELLKNDNAIFTVRYQPCPPSTVSIQPIKVSDVDAVRSYQDSAPHLDINLPLDVKYYLKCHGWTSQRMLSRIEAAYALNTEPDPFVALLADLGMPMTNAEYLVTLLYLCEEEK
ncbi:hypothetical protein DFP72DRAFT_1065128 [Ephemerocybe angulata]|uniref:Uncharacterized protein n=1 Tax=Ephemerocybe angulata TaxID=980116 RepID=A0A8H6I5L2_9AGAR|nr:hypothetical protein DFP72DRAFT_1065128 [Tulosesus angulatus]